MIDVIDARPASEDAPLGLSERHQPVQEGRHVAAVSPSVEGDELAAQEAAAKHQDVRQERRLRRRIAPLVKHRDPLVVGHRDNKLEMTCSCEAPPRPWAPSEWMPRRAEPCAL